MEFDVSNIFSPDYLYGDLFDDIMGFLSVTIEHLNGQTASDFQNVICKHLDRVRVSKVFQLPSFGEGFEWLNTSCPLTFDSLKNKIYVMDFFTYCCINCIHILPHLKKVENCFADNPAFTVLGIHSPKFPNEKDLMRVKEAVIRNNIKHPVLNDSESKLWKTYGISCWPTIFIVGPAHTLLFVLIGEAHIDKLFFLCNHIFKYYESLDVKLDLHPLPLLQMKEDSNETGLLFPGNVSTNGECIVVSDTGHNRLLLMSKSFEVKEIIGCGLDGCKDGAFDSASFNSPHGTAWFNDSVYVADTGNHSIRKVCLQSKTVTTVFSREMNTCNMSSGLADRQANFQSPWDVCIGPKLDSDLSKLNVLYIAVAGSHQIWSFDLETHQTMGHNFCIPFAGSGKEENRQNFYRFKAGFAQPSGVTYSSMVPEYLFVADSESSTIKSIAMKDGAVKVIAGGGKDPSDLFQFGDKDGKYIDVKLQHPMSVCVLNANLLAITDTYNHKIKLVNIKEKECFTYITDVDLCEPSGICVMEDKLLVADTNNHRVVPITISEDKIDKIQDMSKVAPAQFDQIIEIDNVLPEAAAVTVIPLTYGGKLFCHFQLSAHSKYELNRFGSQKCDVSFDGNFKLHVEQKSSKLFGGIQPSLILQPHSAVEENDSNLSSEVLLTVALPLCDKNMKLCSIKKINFKFTVSLKKSENFKFVCLNFNAVVD